MRKSILRFGALALMSMMSISVWAQTDGETIYDGQTNKYTVKDDPATPDVVEVVLAEIVAGKTVEEDQVLDLTAGFTLGADHYLVTEVGKAAGKNYSNGALKVILPTELKVGMQGFNNTELTIVVNDGILKGQIDYQAFAGATIESSISYSVYFDFSGATFESNVFQDAKFPGGTTVFMGSPESLPAGLFAVSQDNQDFELLTDNISTIKFDPSCQLKSVGSNAFQGRNICNFGYYSENLGRYLLPATLTTIGDYAFEGVTNLSTFKFAAAGRISSVGKYAFNGCTWMNNEVFAAVCKDFAYPFIYGEGSFQGCGFMNVDLTGSEVTVTRKNGNLVLYNGIGVPKNAFKGNNLSSITLPAGCVAIQESAFENDPIEVISLPEGIKYVDKNALAYGSDPQSVAQPQLFLPQSLKEIGEDALKNRYIENVYAYPEFDESTVPTISATQTGLVISHTTIPVVAPWKYLTNPTAPIAQQAWGNRTSKDIYTAKNWGNYYLQYAALPIGGFNYISNGVKYSVVAPADDPSFEYTNGFSVATISGFAGATATVYGMLSIDNANNAIEVSSHTDPEQVYSYDVIAMVHFDDVLGITTDGADVVKNITFEPKKSDTTANLIDNATETFYDNHIYTLPVDDISNPATGVFQNWTGLSSVTFGKGITAIPALAFSGCPSLTTANFAVGTANTTVTEIGASAFAGTGIKTLELPEGILTVKNSAFADITGDNEIPSSLRSVTLPSTLQTLEAAAFGGSNLAEVKVKYHYDKIVGNPQTHPYANKLIPALDANPFKTQLNNPNAYRAVLVLADGVADPARRDDYMLDDYWKKFFDQTVGVKVSFETGVNGNDQKDFHRLATEDINGVRTYVLQDGATQVSVDANANVPAQYVRSFKNNNLQSWFVPFDYKYTTEDAAAFDFYYFFDTELGANGTDVLIELKKVEAGVTIKANTPYIVKYKGTATDADPFVKTFPSNGGIKATSAKTVTVSNASHTYDITGLYQRTAGANSWYGLSGSAFKQVDHTSHANAYRVKMTATHINNNPYGLVKFVVLDDEDATAIKDINAESLTAPMFDLMGRQITSPAKGQVYIQNGVKKLAK